MRYKEILEEGAKAFLPMYQGLPILDQQDITNFIDKVERAFGRKDRVTWFCRWHRIWYVNQIVPELEAKRAREAREAGQPEPTEPLVSEKTWRRMLSSISPSITFEEAVSEAGDTLSSFKNFEHYMDLPIQGIKDIVWDKQMPDDLLEQFDNIEAEWQETLKRSVRLQPSDEKIIDFKNGWAWWNLNRSGCRDEANAMGHCGNGEGKSNETILSLRKQMDDYHLEPHLTFILQDGDTLGEMKGRNNEKPVERYHKMIKALLMSKYVQEIKGGGYLPEENFDLKDLPEAEQEEIKRKKPGLRPAWELWAEYQANLKKGIKLEEHEINMLHRKVEREADRYGGAEEFLWGEDEMIIEKKSLHSYTMVTRSLVSELSNLLEGDDLVEMIEKYASNDQDLKDADRMARHVENLFYIPMVKTILPYDMDYRLYQVSQRLNDKEEVELFMGISEFLYLEDEDTYGLSTFDEESDGNNIERFDHIEGFTDPIEQAIFDYLLAEHKKEFGWGKEKGPGGDPSSVAYAVLAQFGSKDDQNGGGGRYYTPTIDDPRQMRFDFDKE